ncbi:uncharacterized protein KD926_008711 [Aspergillus affinis]|uniref:uncharacterized protein n=1 Tax=Aspergillus affinis TaxID=1070780 RepID=UPI0022FEC883|nr:uncharacterized protein KD926_008711 [Aspergillus affinis]KAI9040020.1 hypothetical protein KD926_008711 [Aspergillus affinis]
MPSDPDSIEMRISNNENGGSTSQLVSASKPTSFYIAHAVKRKNRHKFQFRPTVVLQLQIISPAGRPVLAFTLWHPGLFSLRSVKKAFSRLRLRTTDIYASLFEESDECLNEEHIEENGSVAALQQESANGKISYI